MSVIDVIGAELKGELYCCCSIISVCKAFPSVPWRGETHQGKPEVLAMGI